MKKNVKNVKKLKLNKLTVSNLDNKELNEKVGGGKSNNSCAKICYEN